MGTDKNELLNTIDDKIGNVVEDVKEVVEDAIVHVKGTKYIKTGVIAILSIIIGFIGLAFFNSMEEYAFLSSIPAIIVNMGIGTLLFYVIDRWALPELDLIEEIKNGNKAAAILVASIVALIVASIITT